VLERLRPALFRIVELHCGRIEGLWVEAPAGPPKCRLVLLVLGIGDDLKKLCIAVDTSAVLRRTPTFPCDTISRSGTTG
jgi:hypothetical protein